MTDLKIMLALTPWVSPWVSGAQDQPSEKEGTTTAGREFRGNG